MGITTHTYIKCTCDICGKDCAKEDATIDITTHYNMDSRCYIYGELFAYIPYGTSKGIVCKECKLQYLEDYINQQRSSN